MPADARLLGLHVPITRWDFNGATLIGSGAVLLGATTPADALGLASEWNGYAGVGDYARSNGNVAAVVNAAHGVRDGLYEARHAAAPLVDESYDLIIVINRWGHAYIAPQPGLYFGTAGGATPFEAVRARYGRVAFAQSELSVRQSWGRAAQESRRARAGARGHRPARPGCRRRQVARQSATAGGYCSARHARGLAGQRARSAIRL